MGADVSARKRAAGKPGSYLSKPGAIRKITGANARGDTTGASRVSELCEFGGHAYAHESFYGGARGGEGCAGEKTGFAGPAFLSVQSGFFAERRQRDGYGDGVVRG